MNPYTNTIIPSYELLDTSEGIEIIDYLNDTILDTQLSIDTAVNQLRYPCNLKIGDTWGRLGTDGKITPIRIPALVLRKQEAEAKPRKRKNRKFLYALNQWWEDNRDNALDTGANSPLPELQPTPPQPPTPPSPDELDQLLAHTPPAERSTDSETSEPTAQSAQSAQSAALGSGVGFIDPVVSIERGKRDVIEPEGKKKGSSRRGGKPRRDPGRKPDKNKPPLVTPKTRPRRATRLKIGAVALAGTLIGAVGVTALAPHIPALMPTSTHTSSPTPHTTKTHAEKTKKNTKGDKEETSTPSTPATPPPSPDTPVAEQPTPAADTPSPAPPSPAAPAPAAPAPVVTVTQPAPANTVIVQQPAPQVTITRPAPAPAPPVTSLHTQVRSQGGTVIFTAQVQGSNPPPVTATIGSQTITLTGGTGTINLPPGNYTWTTQCATLRNTGSINVY